MGGYSCGDRMKNYDRNDENYVYYFVGKNIRKYRKKKGWTQEELATKSQYSKQFISNMENETYQTFSLGTIWKIAMVLEIDAYKLLMESEKEEIVQKKSPDIKLDDQEEKKSYVHN